MANPPLLKFYLTSKEEIPALQARIAEMREQTLQELREVVALTKQITEQGLILPDTALSASLIAQLGPRYFESRLAWLVEVEKLLQALPAEAERDAWTMANYQKAHKQLQKLLKKYQ